MSPRSSPEKANLRERRKSNPMERLYSTLYLPFKCMTATQLFPTRRCLSVAYYLKLRLQKFGQHITRAVHSNQEGSDAFEEFVIYPVVGHDGSVTSVNFSHDNNWLLTSSCDRTVRLWSHSQSDPLLTLSSVNHNFATELGSSAKLKVSGLIYFGDPLFASGQQTVTKCMGESRELTRKPHTKGNAASPLACSLAGRFARQNWRAWSQASEIQSVLFEFLNSLRSEVMKILISYIWTAEYRNRFKEDHRSQGRHCIRCVFNCDDLLYIHSIKIWSKLGKRKQESRKKWRKI